ncbi:MAG: LytR C-terminal domain-containing protein [Actinomycetota bacterium]|nr:LytR C-terminal domain-containing protein [Actinomycetota bacterium]
MGRHSAGDPSAASGEQPTGRDAFSAYPTGEQGLVPPGPAPRLRRRIAVAAAIALLGVILLVFGLVSLLSGDPPSTTAQDTTASSTSTVAETATAGATTTATTPPGTPTASSAPVLLPVTVLNSSPNLTRGLATRVAAALEAGGWPIVELINYNETQLDATTAFFTPGNAAEEAAARALVIQFPEISGGAVPRFDGLAGSGLTVAAVGDWLP